MSARLAIRLTSVGLALALAGSVALGGTIGLSWDASSGASGYRVYYGAAENDYFPTPLYDGSDTSVTINDPALADCNTWHFAVTAYNAAGESGFSPDVASWPRPRIDSVTPASAMQGSQFTFTIDGGSFNPDSISINNENVVLENASVSCNQIQILATVEPTAPGARAAEVGEFTLTIENQDGLTTSEVDSFEVLIDPARFDVNQSEPETVDALDGMDRVWLLRVFPSREGDATYLPDYDFDGDGWIDGSDLAYLAGDYFGACWDGASWKVSACE